MDEDEDGGDPAEGSIGPSFSNQYCGGDADDGNEGPDADNVADLDGSMSPFSISSITWLKCWKP